MDTEDFIVDRNECCQNELENEQLAEPTACYSTPGTRDDIYEYRDGQCKLFFYDTLIYNTNPDNMFFGAIIEDETYHGRDSMDSRVNQDRSECCQYGFQNSLDYLIDACYTNFDPAGSPTYEWDFSDNTCYATDDGQIKYYLTQDDADADTNPLGTAESINDYTYEDLEGCCESVCTTDAVIYFTTGSTYGDNSDVYYLLNACPWATRSIAPPEFDLKIVDSADVCHATYVVVNVFTSPFGGECSASRDYIFPSPSIYAKEIDCCSYDENRSDEENDRYLATCTSDESTGKITFGPPEGSPSDPSVCVQEGTSTNYLDKEGEIVYTEPGAAT